MFSRALLLRRGTVSAVLGTCTRSSRIHPRAVASYPQQALALRASRSFSLARVLNQEAKKDDDTSLAKEVPRTPSGSVYISNVPFSVTVEQLEEAFAQFGRVRSVRLLSSQNGSPRGAGFIEFETAEEAAAFVDSDVQDPIFLLDKNLFVQHADFSINPHREPSATLVAQHFDIGSEDFVRGLFSEYADSLVGVRIPKLKGGSGMAFIEFSTVEDATRALHAENGRMLPEKGRLLRLQYSRPSTRHTVSAEPSLSSRLSQRQRTQGEGVGF